VQPGATNILHHNLTGIVETAVRASYSQGEDSDVRERVHVSTMEASSGDDLYSVFSLEYKVQTPCSAVITWRCVCGVCCVCVTRDLVQRRHHVAMCVCVCVCMCVCMCVWGGGGRGGCLYRYMYI
jgi:hypothetical protein